MICCPWFLRCSHTILGSFRFLCGCFGKHALRHHVLRCSQINHNSDFLPCPLGSSCASLDQMVHSHRRLLFFVAFCKVVESWSLIISFFPLGDSVPGGPTPFSLIVKCLHQVHCHMMNVGHFPHLCCWSTCSFKFRSHLYLDLDLCSYRILCLCHSTNQVYCPWSLSCLPFLHRFFCHSPTHQLHAIAHTSSNDMWLLAS